MRVLKVKNNESGQRIDKYIRKYLNTAPLSYIYKLFRKKDVKVNGKRVDINYIINEDDEITIYVTDETLKEFNTPKKISSFYNPIDIVYEDANILIINKDAGVIVHEGEDNNTNTLNNDILNYLKNKNEYQESDLFTPSCVHRLDYNTSGLIVAAKTLEASKELLELFKDKDELEKEYLALVVGKTEEKGVINKPLLKDSKEKFVKVSKNGLTAISEYTRLTNNNEYSLLRVKILTGRTHQIRVHMASINHPVVGDDKYGDFKANKVFKEKYGYNHQFLHSYKLTFHKLDGVLSYLSNKAFVAPLKKEKQVIVDNLFPNFKLN